MAIDLITELLQLDPDRRPSAETLLRHPYLAKYHFPNDEVMFVRMIVIMAKIMIVDDFCSLLLIASMTHRLRNSRKTLMDGDVSD